MKTKSCDGKLGLPTQQGALVWRAQLSPSGSRKSGKYHKKAGELDLEQGTAPGGTGPSWKELSEYGQKG